MIKRIKSLQIALRLWIISALILGSGIFIYLLTNKGASVLVFFVSIIATTIGSIPAFIVLILALSLVNKSLRSYFIKVSFLLCLLLVISCLYGAFAGFIFNNPFTRYSSLQPFFITAAQYSGCVMAAIFIAFFINLKYINTYFLSNNNQIKFKMEAHSNQPIAEAHQSSQANKIWIKGLITGGLILIMLIPTVFVSNLVQERQQRQQEVKQEVSNKWAGEQNITFPYLFIPYTITTIQNARPITEKRSFLILPDNLNVAGSVTTEERQRSIYTVLLYSSSLNANGNFNIQIPADVDASTINWSEAKVCLGISDFKGIQQKITAKINNINYDLSAGLPSSEIDTTGLSSSIQLSADDINKSLLFQLALKLKGSDQLHFTPLAGNSQFNLKSNWNSPSFDGTTLPTERNFGDKGFEANWNFNKANLPFNTTLKNFNFKKDDYAFGVTLLQPADQYAKTLRCVKYAILFIGLTYSLFFIIEIMQKKPFHPVQYVLVGLALIVFFTLLLSISEFLLFDVAYLIASVATILLITFYSKSHFKSWKIAGVFAATISSIYGFIYVLISLEDTALLVGSIGLFIILALAMYGSRKINWYGNNFNQSVSI